MIILNIVYDMELV